MQDFLNKNIDVLALINIPIFGKFSIFSVLYDYGPC